MTRDDEMVPGSCREVTVDVVAACRRKYGRPVSTLSPEEVGVAVLEAAGQPVDLGRALWIGRDFFANAMDYEPAQDEPA